MRVASTRAGLYRVAVGVLLSSMALVGLTACTVSMPDANPYAEEISRALDNASSDYVREILSDGQITAAEARDSQKQNVACLSDAGISAEYIDSGAGYESLVTVDAQGATADSAMSSCHKKWVGEIESIYVSQISNPQNKDFDALIAACLVAKKLVPEGFTGADFRELIAQTSLESSSSAEGSVAVDVTGDIILPGGESMSNPQAVMCQVNPSQ